MITSFQNLFRPGNTKIWYAKNLRDFSDSNLPVLATLQTSHVLLGTMESENLDKIFQHLQGEMWSPDGQARQLIQSLGLTHTSMSAGDVIELAGSRFYACKGFGFALIT